MAPIVIRGVAVAPDEHSVVEQAGLILIEGPEGNYGGFSGGPDASVDEHGMPKVWGTIVYQGYNWRAGRWRYVLGAAPLPHSARAAGEWVLVGGFLIPGAGVTAVEYLDFAPAAIPARLLRASDLSGAGLTPAWTLLPARFARGFVGGPVARRGKDGEIRVWGIVIRFTALPALPEVGSVFWIAPLPAEMAAM